MSLRTKIFSLVVLVLLFLPVVFNTSRTGEVLGTNESNTSTSGLFGNFNQNDTQPSVTPAQSEVVSQTELIGEIGSGVRVAPNSQIVDPNTIFEGKAIVNVNSSLVASSDKFPLGTSVNVSNGDREINVVIQGRTVLAADTMLVLNQETFENLGGTSTGTPINITVRVNN